MVFGALERLLESAAEGPVRRWLRPRLQPIHLAKTLARAVDEGRSVGPDGPVAPNLYLLRLHPTDFAKFADYQHGLATDLARYLTRVISERHLRLLAPIHVQLLEDESVQRGALQAQGRFADVEPDIDAADVEPGGTARLPVVASPAPGRAVEIELADGRSFRLRSSTIRIGRGAENDVVIPDGRVSRAHAEVRAESGGFVLADLGSTNGTWIDGDRIASQPLSASNRVSLGGYEITIKTASDDGERPLST